MVNTTYKELVATNEGRRLLQQERTILEATELICALLEAQNVSRAELSRRLGVTKSAVSQMLDGEQNMTLRSLSDMLFVLGRAVDFQCRNVEDERPVYYKYIHAKMLSKWNLDAQGCDVEVQFDAGSTPRIAG